MNPDASHIIKEPKPQKEETKTTKNENKPSSYFKPSQQFLTRNHLENNIRLKGHFEREEDQK